MKGRNSNLVGQDVNKMGIIDRYVGEEKPDHISEKSQEDIWEDLIIGLLGLNSEYNHLLPAEDDETQIDLLNMQIPAIDQIESFSTSHVINQAPSTSQDSFHSNPIESPTEHVALTVLSNECTHDRTIKGCFTRVRELPAFITFHNFFFLASVCRILIFLKYILCCT